MPFFRNVGKSLSNNAASFACSFSESIRIVAAKVLWVQIRTRAKKINEAADFVTRIICSVVFTDIEQSRVCKSVGFNFKSGERRSRLLLWLQEDPII